jgi:cellulose synthase/poly-beta-1,6-N-acetylglucosamine synthase-like glycosyltransferase
MKEKGPVESYIRRLLTVALFLMLTVFGVGFSIYLFSTAESLNMFLLAALFFVLSIVTGFFNVYSAFLYYKSYFYNSYLDGITKKLKPLGRQPTVAVAVPVFNEDPRIVERNMLRLFEVKYPKSKLKFYLLDDSNNGSIVNELSEFSKKHGIVYLHRTDRSGFKAKALNEMLKVCKEEFIAIFDYDEYLTNKDFLVDLLPYFSDKELAYIQTEKTTFKGTFLSDSINLFDAFFYKFIQPARALNNTAIFAGSCGIIRKSILEEVGGFPECVIEDTFFSFESDAHNFKGLYYPKIYAYGRPVTTFTALVKQQWRYNYGDTQFISYFFKSKRRGGIFKRMSWISDTDYIVHGFGLNYLSVTLILFTITSFFVVFSGLPLLHLTVDQVLHSNNIYTELELFGGLAFLFSILTPIIFTKMYFNSMRKGLMVFVLNFALAVARTKAALAAMLSRNPSLQWSRVKDKRRQDLLFSVRNTVVELSLSIGLFILGAFAIITSSISGGFWLLWYGVMYLSATMLLYKYG